MTAWQRFRAFFSSPHHLWLGALTLGAGFATADFRYATLGVAAYVLGWIYLPDMSFFREWAARKLQKENTTHGTKDWAVFQMRMKRVFASLTRTRQLAYENLAQLGAEIENMLRRDVSPGHEAELDSQLEQIDRLMWTYLKLLQIDQDQQGLIQREHKENIPAMLRGAISEVEELEKEMQRMDIAAESTRWEAINRLCNSKKDRVEVLRRRAERLARTEGDLQLTLAEQDRLVDLFKLMRSKAHNLRDATEMTHDISTGVRQVEDDLGGWSPQIDLAGLEDDPFPSGRRAGRAGYMMHLQE